MPLLNEKKEFDYSKLSDEELLDLIKINNDRLAQEFIIHKYKNLVRIKAHAYFITGADKEDIVQEGMIGLYKAIRDYNRNKLVSFGSFAKLCITRQIITAIKAATRQKHIPLNSYVSLNKTIFNDELTVLDILYEKRISNPEELYIGREEKDFIEQNLNKVLSKLERNVLDLYLQGISYLEISKLITKDEKAIDNALQRVRKKVIKILLKKNLTPNSKYVNM